jgi:hypothetical protein
MMKLFKAVIIILATVGSASAQTGLTRADDNLKTFEILKRTPVSILSYGISRLDERLRDLGSNDWYFDNLKQEKEYGLLQAFVSFVVEEGDVSPVIMVRATLVARNGRPSRSKASAEVLCQKLLVHTADTAKIYLDEDNDFFSGLWLEKEVFPDYNKSVDHDSIQSMIYLKARVGHAGSDDFISCGRFF